MSYILVMYIYAGVLANGDSVAINHIDGFSTIESCQQAGNSAARLVKGSAKEYRFICMEKK
jgi:hypothetical protein